jgi:hypothetical protein
MLVLLVMAQPMNAPLYLRYASIFIDSCALLDLFNTSLFFQKLIFSHSAFAYCIFLLNNTQCPSPYSTLSLFPCPAPTDSWKAVSLSLFPFLANHRILYSNIQGGCYLTLKQSILLEYRATTSAFLAAPPSTTSTSTSTTLSTTLPRTHSNKYKK